MKFVVFGDQKRVGLLDGDSIIDVNNAATKYLSEKRGVKSAAEEAAVNTPANLTAFIEAGDRALDLTREAAEYVAGSDDASITSLAKNTKLHAPWPQRRIACAGANYAQHTRNAIKNSTGEEMSLEEIKKRIRGNAPAGFWKITHEVMGPGDDITYPGRTQLFDYEAEAAFVFGKRGMDIPGSKLSDYIWGVTLLNDWSIREMAPIQIPMSFNLPKNFDCCVSLGPCIVVGEADPGNLDVKLTVNGEARQDYNSSDMEYSFAEIVEFLSKDLTFLPGDVLSGGTSFGTAMDASQRGPDGKPLPDLFLSPGDVVEMSSPQVGSLRNGIVKKKS